MRNPFLLGTLAAVVLGVACGTRSDDDDDGSDDDSAADDDSADDDDSAADDDSTAASDDDTIELPPSPLPIEVDLGGAASETATFDVVECAHPPNNNLQLTWRNSADAYTWAMRVFVRAGFEGAAGTFTEDNQVQVLENFSGGRFFSGTTGEGLAISVTVDGFGSNGAYGGFTTDPLPGDGGSVTLSPQPIPFWCDAIAE